MIFPHFLYLSNYTCILGSIRLTFANKIDAMQRKETNIQHVLNWSPSISEQLEHPFWGSVAQLLASMSGVVLGGVVEIVDSNLACGKIFTAYIALFLIKCKIRDTCTSEIR